jgi:hypothetical protein
VTRSENQLQAAASRVGDELVQLAAMPDALRAAGRSGDRRVANACLQSMLLHARNLMEFLIEPYWPSDIHRMDFAPEWSPPNISAKERLRDARPIFDRQLSHLNWDLIDGDAPDHDSERIAYDIVEVMGTFVEHLRAEGNRTVEWFDAYLLQARLLLQQGAVADREPDKVGSAHERVATTECRADSPLALNADLLRGPAATVSRHVQRALGMALGVLTGVVDNALRRTTSIPRRLLSAAASRTTRDD